MFGASHCVPSTPPTLNAALSAYHIMRLPAPDKGGLPGVVAVVYPVALNTTLLSLTCSFASGVAVPIPTLPLLLLCMSAVPDGSQYPPLAPPLTATHAVPL